jgi:adenosylcobinamide-GDP ribazoletransferase
VTDDSAPDAVAACRWSPLRFAFGTLTVLPVRVGRWDREAARTGMACAPVVGLVVGLAAAMAGGGLRILGGGALLAAVAAVAVPAVLTRGLHLDGLADTADGLGSGKPAEAALRVMKQSDIGPFGVLAVVFVLFAQVAALSGRYADGWAKGAVAAIVAAVTARGAMTLACRHGVPPARRDGLGSVVAESLSVRTAWTLTVLTVLVAALGGALFSPYAAVHHALAALAGLASAELLLRRFCNRLGGVTGDVFGALAEAAATTTLVILAIG